MNVHSVAKVPTSCEAVPQVLQLTVLSTIVMLTHILLSMHTVPQVCVTHFVTCPVILLRDSNFSQRAEHHIHGHEALQLPKFYPPSPLL